VIDMNRGFPSLAALLGLLAIAGYQNRDSSRTFFPLNWWRSRVADLSLERFATFPRCLARNRHFNGGQGSIQTELRLRAINPQTASTMMAPTTAPISPAPSSA
jgi:hypothetical protein